MYNTILFKAPGKPSSKPVVILSGVDARRKCPTTVAVRLSRTLSQVWNWTKCNCAPARLLRIAFSEKASMAVAIVATITVWWHLVSTGDSSLAGRRAAIDCALALPWGIVWAIRATLMPLPDEFNSEKGGAL